MPRKVSIGWFKQKSGRYALKGIAICENDCTYDSTGTFRDEDARWLTKVLGAEARVELSGSKVGERTTDGCPEWALKTGQEAQNPGVSAFDRERANATLLRHILGQIVASCYTESGSSGCRKIAVAIDATLVATDVGTYYTPEEARTILYVRSHRASSPHKQITMSGIAADARSK